MSRSDKQPQMSILVIDDDPEIRSSVGMFLQARGYMVYEAADGFVGVRVLRREAVPTWTQSCGTAITRGHLLTGLRGSPGSARGACCVVVRGAAIRGSFARRVASGTVPITGTTTSVFELPGRLPLEALHHYVFYGEFSNFLFGGNNQSHALRPVGKSIS